MSTKDDADVIRQLSDRIVVAQAPIRILDAIKWHDDTEVEFFANNAEKLPQIDAAYYEHHNPLGYDLDEKINEFRGIHSDIQRNLGQFSPLGGIMQRTCDEYVLGLEMLRARGTDKFGQLAVSLYGSSEESFYAGGPSIRDLALLLVDKLPAIIDSTEAKRGEANITAAKAADMIAEKLKPYFSKDNDLALVELSDTLVSDAAAGAEAIRLRSDAMFSKRDVALLEVHEGWVHLGTTLNGKAQPTCTFLSKGSPATAITQEGLAVLMEVFTFTSFPQRLQKLTNRILAIDMATDGGNFIDVYHFFLEHGYSEHDAYKLAVRVFRGSTADGKPFTKDLAYTKGFVMIYNFIRLAIQENQLDLIPLLFIGKTRLEDLHIYASLVKDGIIEPPKYLPSQFKDMAALSSWMCFSLFINQIDFNKLADDYKQILRK
tara:strand:+ start:1972 stop:3264 length:1293 start_codon:yes stop_codon:yes gene_type:complete